MSWMALAYVTAIFVVATTLLVEWIWPRNRDGSKMSIEDVYRIIGGLGMKPGMAPPPRDDILIAVFLALASIGIAITHQSWAAP